MATTTPFVHEGPRRTATATPFCPRRAAKNCNCNTFLSTKDTEGHGERQLQHLLSAKGREGARRTATATPFCPRRATEDHGGPRRTTENGNCNTFCPRRATKGREGPRRTATSFVREGARRVAKNGNCNTFLSTEGHGELQWLVAWVSTWKGRHCWLDALLGKNGHGG